MTSTPAVSSLAAAALEAVAPAPARRARKPLGLAPASAGAAPPDLRAAPVRVVLEATLAELIDLYFAARPCTHMAGAFKKWIEWFKIGELSAWSMTPERLGAGAAYLREQGYKVSTVNRELSQLGTVYRWAIEQKLAPVGFVSPTIGPAAGRKKEETRHVENARAGEWDRMRKLARGFRDPLFTAFVWLVMDTGARRGEISDRLWTDFNLDDDPDGPNVVLKHADTKTGRARRLFFSHETAALLRRLRPAGEKYRAQLVFKSKRGVQPNAYRKPWTRLCDLLGRPGLHLQDVRHLLAADLLKAGKGMSPVAALLGHSSLVLHRRYGHLDDKSIRDIQAERLGLDAVPKEFEPVREARARVAERQASTNPLAEAERLALLAQDAANAAVAAAAAHAAALEALRAARVPLVERVR